MTRGASVVQKGRRHSAPAGGAGSLIFSDTEGEAFGAQFFDGTTFSRSLFGRQRITSSDMNVVQKPPRTGRPLVAGAYAVVTERRATDELSAEGATMRRRLAARDARSVIVADVSADHFGVAPMAIAAVFAVPDVRNHHIIL